VITRFALIPPNSKWNLNGFFFLIGKIGFFGGSKFSMFPELTFQNFSKI
jgi:hypothetical protein